ncbi:MAG: F0F1 ATP synthase subunit A [Candidatus Pacebacteria bacterium]|nr:F0F1 ATP synthase subunit A [Candidatus Paceibacterota bacterium]
MFRIHRETSGVTPDTIMTIGDFKIANTTLTSILILLVFAAICFFVIRKYRVRPNKSQTAVEILFESMLDLIKQITGGEKYAKAIFPLIASLFLYIGFSNLISIIPGLMSITIDGVSIFRSPTSDFNTTFGLALGAVVLTNIVSIKDWGFFGHLGKFFKFKDVYLGFKKGLKSGVMAIIDFAIGLLDIIGELAKVVSLSLRLFGNMYAGEILATLILGAFAYGIPILWTSMSLLSGVIQAIVFGSLTTAYYMLAVKIKEGEEGT